MSPGQALEALEVTFCWKGLTFQVQDELSAGRSELPSQLPGEDAAASAKRKQLWGLGIATVFLG